MTDVQHNKKTAGMDINVTGIWEHNITGSGIIVAVIDDGKWNQYRQYIDYINKHTDVIEQSLLWEWGNQISKSMSKGKKVLTLFKYMMSSIAY